MPGNVADLEPWTIGVDICLRIFWGFRVLASLSYGWIVLSVTVTELSTLTYFPLKISSLLFANFKVNPSTLSTKYNPSSNKESPLTTLLWVSPLSLITSVVTVVLARYWIASPV